MNYTNNSLSRISLLTEDPDRISEADAFFSEVLDLFRNYNHSDDKEIYLSEELSAFYEEAEQKLNWAVSGAADLPIGEAKSNPPGLFLPILTTAASVSITFHPSSVPLCSGWSSQRSFLPSLLSLGTASEPPEK